MLMSLMYGNYSSTEDFLIYALGLLLAMLIAIPFHEIAHAFVAYKLGDPTARNMVFMVFNLLPIPPLDGFHVASSAFIRKRYYIVDFLRQYGFIILMVLLFTNILDPIFNFVIGGFQSLFLSFYSLFLG